MPTTPMLRSPNPATFVSVPWWQEVLNLSRAEVNKLIRDNQLPPPSLVLNRKRRFWRLDDALRFLDSRGRGGQ